MMPSTLILSSFETQQELSDTRLYNLLVRNFSLKKWMIREFKIKYGFLKRKEKSLYDLVYHLSGNEWGEINFRNDKSDSSICTMVEPDMIENYLYGYLGAKQDFKLLE